MTPEDYAEEYRSMVEEEIVEIVVVEDDDCRQDDLFVTGSFNPCFERESLSKPIRIEIICNTSDAWVNLTEKELKHFDSEFVRTVTHELVHLEQYQEGRFLINWKGDYLENPNETEAYEREYDGNFREGIAHPYDKEG